jgi:hypothetical protein
MKTTELIGASLDWAVTVAEQPEVLRFGAEYWQEQRRTGTTLFGEYLYRWSASWSWAGPIIEREMISLDYFMDGGHENGGEWMATRISGPAVDGLLRIAEGYGPTPLIAAMRCYVASKLGDKIDVPSEVYK